MILSVDHLTQQQLDDVKLQLEQDQQAISFELESLKSEIFEAKQKLAQLKLKKLGVKSEYKTLMAQNVNSYAFKLGLGIPDDKLNK